MFKLIFALAFIMTISSEMHAVQIIHSSSGSRSSRETYELNQREEQQELLRRQVEMQRQQLQVQQEMLNIQKQQQRYIYGQ